MYFELYLRVRIDQNNFHLCERRFKYLSKEFPNLDIMRYIYIYASFPPQNSPLTHIHTPPTQNSPNTHPPLMLHLHPSYTPF